MALSSILPYSAIFQIVAVILVGVGIQLLVRYVLSEFIYFIEDLENGSSELVIIKKQGSREVKVCHISLSSVVEIFPKGAKKVKSDNRFNYSQNLTDNARVMLTSDGNKTVEIIIEPDNAFLSALNKRVGLGELGQMFVM